ncbi:hypothetical protein TNCV_2968531 [Trichonephila clavipes]|nr:hypothetical protein TNCV_2968531 [Trichonephila clavipes]
MSSSSSSTPAVSTPSSPLTSFHILSNTRRRAQKFMPRRCGEVLNVGSLIAISHILSGITICTTALEFNSGLIFLDELLELHMWRG